jgi:hypothetical protein
MAEVLALHYSHAAHVGKAFTYLSMAGSKSLGVYSIDEAAAHFTAALALLDDHPDCASADQIADFLVPYTLLLNMNCKLKVMIDVVQRYLTRIRASLEHPISRGGRRAARNVANGGPFGRPQVESVLFGWRHTCVDNRCADVARQV